MFKKDIITSFFVLSLLSILPSFGIANPYASEVISYTPGTNADSACNNPATALGVPSRTTPYVDWGFGYSSPETDVTPFNPAFASDQIVSIGAGGSLVVKFDHPVQNDPSHLFGIDFIVFGNCGYNDMDYPNGLTDSSGSFFTGTPAKIAVSQNGLDWFDINGVYANGNYPAMGYTNSSGDQTHDGTVPSDFTKPVDPSFDPNGKTFSELVAGYNGSGGGTGVDIEGTGLEWIQYVKVYQESGDSSAAAIDGFAIVPEPASLLLILSGLVMVRSRKGNK